MSHTNVDTLSRLFLQIYLTNPLFLSAFDSLDFYLVYTKVVPTCTDFIPLLIVCGLGKHYLHSKDYPISVDRQCHDGYTEIYRHDRRNYSLYRSLNSQCTMNQKSGTKSNFIGSRHAISVHVGITSDNRFYTYQS